MNHPYADDKYSSQGTRQANFLAVNPTGNPVDQSGTIVGHRQTTGRNAPSVINAVFNFRNFWDGRASEVFNGLDPFGNILIGQCAFQYAHGFAFISDVGANRVSEAYLALVLDSGLSSRTLFSSEVLGH